MTASLPDPPYQTMNRNSSPSAPLTFTACEIAQLVQRAHESVGVPRELNGHGVGEMVDGFAT